MSDQEQKRLTPAEAVDIVRKTGWGFLLPNQKPTERTSLTKSISVSQNGEPQQVSPITKSPTPGV